MFTLHQKYEIGGEISKGDYIRYSPSKNLQ